MGFKRLFGIGDPDEAVEVDTQILGPVYPGGDVRGEVVPAESAPIPHPCEGVTG